MIFIPFYPWLCAGTTYNQNWKFPANWTEANFFKYISQNKTKHNGPTTVLSQFKATVISSLKVLDCFS